MTALDAEQRAGLTDDATVERVAWAILKARFYDYEPEGYGHSLERFRDATYPEHLAEARYEARAAINALASEGDRS